MVKKLALVLALLMFSSPVYADKKRDQHVVGYEKFCTKLYLHLSKIETMIYNHLSTRLVNRNMAWDKRNMEEMPREFKEMADKVVIYRHWCQPN